MGYEAKMDAESNYIAEKVFEVYGHSGEDAYAEDAILELIADGHFDRAVGRRAAALGYTPPLVIGED